MLSSNYYGYLLEMLSVVQQCERIVLFISRIVARFTEFNRNLEKPWYEILAIVSIENTKRIVGSYNVTLFPFPSSAIVSRKQH